MELIKTKLETYRVDRKCDSCTDGIMYSTGVGFTTFHTNWEHKCNKCGKIDSYQNERYPHHEYIEIIEQ